MRNRCGNVLDDRRIFHVINSPDWFRYGGESSFSSSIVIAKQQKKSINEQAQIGTYPGLLVY